MGNLSSKKKKKKARKKCKTVLKYEGDVESQENENKDLNNPSRSRDRERKDGNPNETSILYLRDSTGSLLNSADFSDQNKLQKDDSCALSSVRCEVHSASSISHDDGPSTSGNLRYGDPSISSNLQYVPSSSSLDQIGGLAPSADISSDNLDSLVDNESEPVSKVSKLVTAAIDFGTTFSGYAYSLRHNPFNIYTSFWSATGSRTVKAPSSVLFDEDKNFLSFGYEAERRYYEDRSDLRGCYFFQNFKMLLYKCKGQLNEDTYIEDNDVTSHINSKMKAIDVFSAVIGYFKKDIFSTLKKSYQGIAEDDIHWVLTVPAIWDLKAKQFMREAAVKAGIENNQLSLALEPEAASIYCRKLPMFVEEASVGDKKISQLSVGSKYLVLDLGGGTIDATVHEVLMNKKLKEVHQACGGDWGSYTINKNYYNFLCDIFGPDVMQKLQNDYPDDVFDLMNDFEIKKRTFAFDIATRMEKNKIPSILAEIYKQLNGEDINTAIQRTELSGKVRLERDKLYIQNDVICSFFEQTISSIESFLEQLFRRESIHDSKTILAVGGFSKCIMLIDRMKAKYPDLDIVVPLDADLAVLKGAILYAVEPESIVCRVSQYTYGVPKMMRFNPLRHNKMRAINIDGTLWVDNIYDKHVEIGQILNVGEFQPEHEYFPITDDTTTAHLEFCASEEKNLNEINSIVLGTIQFDLVRHNPKQGRIFLKINASGTELIAVIREESTNEEIKCYFSLI